MDVERASLCNCVVNFLLEENYLLSAFELLHELLDDGRDAQAIRLKEFFSDPSLFPPDQISRFNSLRLADPQSLLEEKNKIEEKLAIREYELRLAQEDILKLKADLTKRSESLGAKPGSDIAAWSNGTASKEKECSFLDLGPLKDGERRDLNCAIKEYLVFAGYRLTALTFYEEVKDQDLDVWQNTPASVNDALRRYYYQYLSSSTEAAEERMSILRENETLLKLKDVLLKEKESLMRAKELSDGQIVALSKSLESSQKETKDRENLIQELKKSLEAERKELNDCRAEITSLKMHIEGFRANSGWISADNERPSTIEGYKAEIKSLQMEIEKLKENATATGSTGDLVDPQSVAEQSEMEVVEIHEDKIVVSHAANLVSGNSDENAACPSTLDVKHEDHKDLRLSSEALGSSYSSLIECADNVDSSETTLEERNHPINNNTLKGEKCHEKTGLETIQILSDALPKIVPFVLINHREELLPLIMCAIERHPDSSTRDSLTHTLFNLIKRPDEQQRRIIMDACVNLAKNVGEVRTESELLPQCWEQINHMYEERRLLVAQSCGELAEFVRPEIRASLILSIIQQLVEDSATIVREAAAHNLALLIPLFPDMDKYFKVEELMFQLVCDPSGPVVETSLKELVPAVVRWGNKLDHILRILLSHMLVSAQRCPPLSGVEGSVDSHFRVLGERERWNIDVLLRMLTELLPFVHQRAVACCPFPNHSDPVPNTGEGKSFFCSSLLELYAGQYIEWPAFDWLHVDCFPGLIQLSCLLPPKEDKLRNRLTKFLWSACGLFGDHYVNHIMLPIFLLAVGDVADFSHFPSVLHSRVKGLQPKTTVTEKLALGCALPLLLSGLLGSPGRHEQLAEYLRKLLVQNAERESASPVYYSPELINAVRFLCTFEEHQGIIFNILWEMVVSPNVTMKIGAANQLKALAPCVDVKTASANVLPALVTLGSDPNVNVKYSSIEAFGYVAQHFKSDMIVDKIRVQMDAFLEDGSHEATLFVFRALVVAIPHTTDKLRNYVLSKIFHLSSLPTPGVDLRRRRERADAFCESVRALDATDLPASTVKDLLLPTVQNLLKDTDALDPAHKEALEVILRERSGGAFDALSKVMGAHLGIASSVSSLFGDSGRLGKKESADTPEQVAPPQLPAPEDTRFRRIMRGSFSEMIRGKPKAPEESSWKQ
ncbi:uncharacterized protein LOC116247963 [Nymphaea colorata]|nr:uncharacterized protein LOC116247963 [Nymphaea colorata]